MSWLFLRSLCLWWGLADNVISNMQNAGLSVMESFDNDIHGNVVDVARYGIRFSVGAGRNMVHDNTFKNTERGESSLHERHRRQILSFSTKLL